MDRMFSLKIDNFYLNLIGNIDEEKLGKAGNYKKLVIQQKDIVCNKLFEDSIHDEPAPKFQKQPLLYLPEPMLREFTYNDRILVKRYFLEDSFPSDRHSGNSLDYETLIDNQIFHEAYIILNS